MGGRMWMGKRGRERWVPAPATGMTYGAKRWSSKTSFLSGGANVRSSIASHLEYEMDWNAISRDQARRIEDMTSGIDGTGLTYFLDPMAMDKNVLPAQWAFPALSALDGPVLWGNARPASVPTESNDLGYPATSAQYTAKASTAMRRSYAWTGTANRSASTETVDGAVARTNYAIDPAPARTDTWAQNYGNGTGGGALVDAAGTPSGKAFRFTFSNPPTGGWNFQEFGLPVPAPGSPFSASMYARHSWAGSSGVVTVEFQTSSGTSLGYLTSGSVQMGPDDFRRVVWSGVVPATAARANVFYGNGDGNMPPAGAWAEVSSLLVEAAPQPTDWFSGATAGERADSTPPSPRSKLYIPIPPGYTAWVGFHGVATGTGGLEVTPIPSEGLVADPVLPRILPVDSDTRVNTAFPSSAYSGIELRYGGGNSTAVTIAGAMVQILRDGVAPQKGGFISGQGHSGCEFDEAPQRQAYSAVVGPGFDGMVGLSAKLTEVGDWI